MTFTLTDVVPWGRSYNEYVAMFSLTPDDLNKNILGCSDGPASFNSTLTKRNGSIISADPLYSCTTEQIQNRIHETYDLVLEQTRQNKDKFVWDTISSVSELGKIRMSAMNEFIKDFDTGKIANRYITASLPHLPFRKQKFDLALCSHFLFLYSEQLSEKFHLDSIRELCRVAQIVRIFPVIELGARKSRHLDTITARLEQEGYQIQLKEVSYEFQENGNQMLELTRRP